MFILWSQFERRQGAINGTRNDVSTTLGTILPQRVVTLISLGKAASFYRVHDIIHQGDGQNILSEHENNCEYEPRHEKTCLRESTTRQNTNRPAQPQKLARVLNFRLQNLEILYYLSSEEKGAARMRRRICTFVVRIWHKKHFLMARPVCFFEWKKSVLGICVTLCDEQTDSHFGKFKHLLNMTKWHQINWTSMSYLAWQKNIPALKPSFTMETSVI